MHPISPQTHFLIFFTTLEVCGAFGPLDGPWGPLFLRQGWVQNIMSWNFWVTECSLLNNNSIQRGAVSSCKVAPTNPRRHCGSQCLHLPSLENVNIFCWSWRKTVQREKWWEHMYIVSSFLDPCSYREKEGAEHIMCNCLKFHVPSYAFISVFFGFLVTTWLFGILTPRIRCSCCSVTEKPNVMMLA